MSWLICLILGTVFLRSIITTDLVGVEHIGPAFGLFTMVEGIGSAVGTPFGGRSFCHTCSLQGETQEFTK